MEKQEQWTTSTVSIKNEHLQYYYTHTQEHKLYESWWYWALGKWFLTFWSNISALWDCSNDEDTMFLWNIRNHSSINMVSQPRIHEPSETLFIEHQILNACIFLYTKQEVWSVLVLHWKAVHIVYFTSHWFPFYLQAHTHIDAQAHNIQPHPYFVRNEVFTVALWRLLPSGMRHHIFWWTCTLKCLHTSTSLHNVTSLVTIIFILFYIIILSLVSMPLKLWFM